jgi:hypothetical protein
VCCCCWSGVWKKQVMVASLSHKILAHHHKADGVGC